MVEVVAERIVGSSISYLSEALVELGYEVYPSYINVYRENELDQQISKLIREAEEEGIKVKTVLIAPNQGPEPGGGELYVTDAPYDVVEKIDEIIEKLENEIDGNVVEFAVKLLER